MIEPKADKNIKIIEVINRYDRKVDKEFLIFLANYLYF